MPYPTQILSQHIASRICHDLASPLGAIANGFELLSMAGDVQSPEHQLIAQSVENATARVKLFRVAFGGASEDQSLASSELSTMFSHALPERLCINWGSTEDVPRVDAKLIALLILCMETAAPRGGEIGVSSSEGSWQIALMAQYCKAPPELWGGLQGQILDMALPPASVQFTLAPLAAQEYGRRVNVHIGETQITATVCR